MAYNLEELRRAMRRGHPRGEMLDGTPFHARAACRVVFSSEGFPVEGMELVEIETWLKPGTVTPRPRRGRTPDARAARRRLRRHHDKLEKQEPPRTGALTMRLDRLAEVAGLGPVERDVLVLAGTNLFEQLAKLRAQQLRPSPVSPLIEVLSVGLAVPPDAVAAALAPGSTLLRAKLIELGAHEVVFRLGEPALRWIFEEVESGPLDEVFEVSAASTLRLDDFAHVGLDAEILRDHLRAMLDRRSATTVGVLGARGSGRTELVRAIATELGATVLTLLKDCDDLTAGDLIRLRLALDAASSRALVVIEADREGTRAPRERRRRRPRRFVEEDVESALDELGVPVVHMLAQRSEPSESPFAFMFASEPTHDLDLVVEVPALPEPLRLRALARAAGHAEDAAPRWLADAAARGASPSAVEKHAKVVGALGHSDRSVADRQLAHLVSREGNAGRLSPPASALAYDPAWLRTDVPVELMLAAMGRSPMGRILMHGEPGTGKSRLARELARRGGLEVVSRTGSELLSMFVGGTEKNLAAAFEEAGKRRALLLLDEVDSFLGSRTGAQRSYEVTQVNELLVQIESFRGWLVCTTNFCEGLDHAAMRRFPIKVKFLPPDERQRRALFDAALAALGVDERDDERSAVDRILVRAARLTPGDVAAVVEQVQILGGVESGLALAERLEREVSYKGGEKKMVGFG